MLARVRARLTFANVVSSLALFVALSTGGAYAANTVFSTDIVDGEVKTADIGTDQVQRPDIQNGAVVGNKIDGGAVTNGKLANNAVNSAKIEDGNVSNADLADGAVGTAKLQDSSVTSAKVLDDSQVGGGLGPSDLLANSVAQSEIATDGVAALEIQDNSIDSGEIVDFQLSNEDIGVLFAEVSAAAGLDNSSGGVTVTRVGAVGGGTYEVDFARNVTVCTAVATIGPSGGGSSNGEVSVADRGGNVEAVFVDTNTSAGAAADRPFRLVVVC